MLQNWAHWAEILSGKGGILIPAPGKSDHTHTLTLPWETQQDFWLQTNKLHKLKHKTNKNPKTPTHTAQQLLHSISHHHNSLECLLLFTLKVCSHLLHTVPKDSSPKHKALQFGQLLIPAGRSSKLLQQWDRKESLTHTSCTGCERCRTGWKCEYQYLNHFPWELSSHTSRAALRCDQNRNILPKGQWGLSRAAQTQTWAWTGTGLRWQHSSSCFPSLLGAPHTPGTAAPPCSTEFWENPQVCAFVTQWGNVTPQNTCTQWAPKWGSHKEQLPFI